MKKTKDRKTNLEHLKKQIKMVNTELKSGTFTYTGPMTVVEFATKINKNPVDLVRDFFAKGKLISMNSTLNDEQIAELCIDFGYDFNKEKEIGASNILEELTIIEEESELESRPPIVTIMGHVDHGKTTLVDYIRKSKITESESGGITQHTGAYYVVSENGHKITFIDTPGHETFTAMRSRGARITDIVIIVLAADDGVKEQTREAINHALDAKVPIIVFVNKMDKPNIDIEKLKIQISKANLVPEEWGGDTIITYGSALTGQGIDELLNTIALKAELLELKENPNRLPIGTVIESQLDKGKGVVSTIIVEKGTLKPRDFIVAEGHSGRIRSIISTNTRKEIDEVTPGIPALITGLKFPIKAGSKFAGFVNEKFAKNFANKKRFEDKQNELKHQNSFVVKENILINNIIIKADVSGTAEALKHAISDIKNDEVVVKIISALSGDVTKSDVSLAKASNATIYAFNNNINSNIKNYAKEEGVRIMASNIVYEITEDVESVITKMKAPKFEEKQMGESTILMIIFSSKIGNIAGCKMESGKFKENCKVKVYRRDKLIFEGVLDSLKRGLNDTKLVEGAKEFGCHIKGFDDIKESDIIRSFEDVEIL